MKKFVAFWDLNFFSLMVFVTFVSLFLYQHVHAGDVRTVKLSQTTVGRIYIMPGRSTVLSFPTKPAKVILGNQGVFAIEYVENDLAIAALTQHSHSDLFVYLDGRRFAFDLATVSTGGDTIVLVRDAIEGPSHHPFQNSRSNNKRGLFQSNRKVAHE
ncbi:MAG: hypothetical protein HYX41_07840 [Bdellovibrio sp.]|nr:hypothetical protein [Bdellovibrio sp.]